MMQFGPEARVDGRRSVSVVPMINVVFLLLVFFLMTATIQPPTPFPITPPASAASDEPGEADVLYLGPDGQLAYGDIMGEAVIAALARRPADALPLSLRADREVSAARVAALLRQLGEAGISCVDLVARGQ